MAESRLPTINERAAPVSVIIPAYNGERFIRAAVESVQSQTLPVSEIIVVDDGSEDDTAAIAKELGATVVQQPNQGVCAARNAGIRVATKNWIGFIDQDDLWEPEKIEHQWRATELYPDAAAISCHMSWFADESIRGQTPEFEPDAGFGKENDGCITYFPEVSPHLPLSRMIDYTSSLLIRRDVLVAAGMFDPELAQNEDLECFLRVVARAPLAIVRESLVWHRVHDRNTSLCDPEGAAVAFEKILDRLHQYPEKYPKRAARAYGEPFARRQASAGRALLEGGQPKQARAVLRQSLARRFSSRSAFLWCLSFLTPGMFRFLLALKRVISANFSGRSRFGHHETE